MRVLTFMPRFWDQIRDGSKRQTCRQRAGCGPGDELSLRGWSGRPYMTPQVTLLDPVVCRKVVPVEIAISTAAFVVGIVLDGQVLDGNDAIWFARNDGFDSRLDMVQFFAARYPRMVRRGEAFVGEVIYWDVPR